MKNLLILISICALSACAPKALDLGAEQVIVSVDPPEKGCKFVSQVTGTTGRYVSVEGMEIDALNQIRNNAYKLGADYIRIVSDRAMLSTGSQYGVTYVGNAYKCP